MFGTVIDGDTAKPIEGAVVHVEWTKTKGILGLTYGETYKIAETITDKEGKFNISKFLMLPVNPPTVVVYKKGYVAWRNDYIFPDYQHRVGLEWKGDNVIKLEPFKRYSHSRHILFIGGDLGLNATSKLYQAYSWENSFARKEEDVAREMRKTKRAAEYTEKEFWQEVVDEVYSQKEAVKK
jgi:hypothetical protein